MRKNVWKTVEKSSKKYCWKDILYTMDIRINAWETCSICTMYLMRHVLIGRMELKCLKNGSSVYILFYDKNNNRAWQQKLYSLVLSIVCYKVYESLLILAVTAITSAVGSIYTTFFLYFGQNNCFAFWLLHHVIECLLGLISTSTVYCSVLGHYTILYNSSGNVLFVEGDFIIEGNFSVTCRSNEYVYDIHILIVFILN